MNCMSSKVRRRKEQMAYDQRKAEEEKYINSLSQEERIAYQKNIDERGRSAMRFLTLAMSISAMGSYCQLSNLKKDMR